METLKIDATKLMTVSRYAEKIKTNRQNVYNWIKDNKLKAVKIDGVTFVVL